MSFAVTLSDIAKSEVDSTVFWFTGRNPEFGERWYRGFNQAIESLEDMPTRCPIAAESEYFGLTIRQLRYRDHRILFRLVDSDGEAVEDLVIVLHVLHLSQGPLYPTMNED